ncbi:hypothetical protein C483_03045 [Natrialba hulunbeirensis JCM 10989]|uniref:Uncharacterized protein n=1 Tax=Natrialba hulunbeirensis JCM 10989 TaxID=1227493 RepID=M0A933_9EURY|nr:BGTF surface domain-containing protein [Natrialba hulunbeirensis]ELY94402.1 hypothetical protein C483_03045 [Natrialba hulunbeirensis JCM 10989]
MPDDSLQTVSNALQANHSRLAVLAALAVALSTVALVAPVAADGASTSTDNNGHIDLDDLPSEVEPPETVEFEVVNTSGDRFDFQISSPDKSFSLEATLEGDDDVTIELDTGAVGADDSDEYFAIADGEVHDVTVHSNDVGDELPGGDYSVHIMTDSSIVMDTLAVAPSIEFHDGLELDWSELDDDPSHTLAGTTGFDSGDSFEIRFETSDDESFLLEEEVVVDEDGQFETTVDLTTLPETNRIDVTAEHNNSTRVSTTFWVDGVEPHDDDSDDDEDAGDKDDSQTESNGIVIVHDGDELELEAVPDQQITGEADLDAGELIEVQLLSSGVFFIHEEVEVDEHGTFELNVDFDYVEPDTGFTIDAESAADPAVNASVPGTIVEPGATDGADENASVEHDETELADSTDADDSLFASVSTWGLALLAVGAVLSVVGISIMLGIGRSGSLRGT